YYVTRAYLTRHGAGPLPRELPAQPYPGIIDATNIPNDYQGALRFADLDLDALGQAIRTDLSDAVAYPALTVDAGLAITCLDQLGGAAARYYRDGAQHQGSVENLAAAAAETTGLNQILLNFGPGGEPILLRLGRFRSKGHLPVLNPDRYCHPFQIPPDLR
ncbi:MAG: hypothetical protein IAF00_10630, partial [Phycisphaerales bacterium]|nr:hypothetical protein [Phycisphaerales bacterium]